MKPPRQARSQKTLERVLDAAEELITERGAQALTVSEVVRRAGSSVGAFYARFPDKDALLAMLHERSCEEALATAELALDPSRWESKDLESVVAEVVRFTVSVCHQRKGLLLAFIALAAANPAYAERRERLEFRIGELLHAFLLGREGEISHRNLQRAAHFAVRLLLGASEYGTLVHRSGEGEMRFSDAQVSAELSRAVLAYLGCPTSGGRRAE